MNTTSPVDYEVNIGTPASAEETDGPFAQLFCDRTVGGGVRVLAVAEPMQRTGFGYFTAAAALAAFEETLIVALKDGVSNGLARAFKSAHDAVRRGNSRSEGGLRAHAGITSIVIEGQAATIGFIPPGQALLVQDGQLYAIPDLQSWAPGFMPCADVDEPEPLGFGANVRPLIRTTQIGSGDQLLLGASSVGRALTNPALGPIRELSEATIMNRVEAGLAASGIEDAYAAWIRCDRAPATSGTIDGDRMAQIERLWHAQPTKQPYSRTSTRPSDPHVQRAARRDEWRTKLIEASERVLGRSDADAIPLDRHCSALIAPGAGSLHRYVAPHTPSLSNWIRARLPRGFRFPHSKRSLAVLIAMLVFVIALAVTHNVRNTRAARQDRVLGVAKTELLSATTATTREAAQPHIELARASLDRALDDGANPEVIDAWRNDLLTVEDRWNGIVRFSNMTRIGTIPANLQDVKPQLMLVGRDLFLIAADVFLVRESDRQLMPLLKTGDRVNGVTVRRITSAAVDDGALIVTDGFAVYRYDGIQKWSATAIVDSDREAGFTTEATGIYGNSYYLFNKTDKQVKKFDVSSLDEEPVDWLGDKAMKHTAHVVDMAVDTDVHLLTSDGTIYTFNRGAETERYAVDGDRDSVSMIAMYGIPETNSIFVVALDNKVAEMIEVDSDSPSRIHYLAPTDSQTDFDATAESAFRGTLDFVVDATTHVVYFVTAEGLWRASFAS